VASARGIPFICLTDEPDLVSDSWTMRRVAPVFPHDPVRSQRELKLRPHAHLADFDFSLYIDNSVILSAPPEEIIARYRGASGLAPPIHSDRDTVLDEFLEVSRLALDDQTRIFEQLNHYQMTDPELLAERPHWTAILLRDHRHEGVRRLGDVWAAHVHRYSRRDQLSFNMACRLADFLPDRIAIDAQRSWFHNWPVTEGRDRNKGPRSLGVSLASPAAQLRALELELAREKASHVQTFGALQAAQARLAGLSRVAETPAPAIPVRASLLHRLARRLRAMVMGRT
jgi:hypothetical protein